jgi:Tfp pilus assembly protein PilF
LSVAHLQSGDFEQGIVSAKKALDSQPRFVPAMHNLALAYLRQQQWIRARYWVRQASRVEPDDPSLRRLRIKLRVHTALGTTMSIVSKAAIIFAPIRLLIARPNRA